MSRPSNGLSLLDPRGVVLRGERLRIDPDEILAQRRGTSFARRGDLLGTVIERGSGAPLGIGAGTRLVVPLRLPCGKCRHCVLGAEHACARLAERELPADAGTDRIALDAERLAAAWALPVEVADDDAVRLGIVADALAGFESAGWAEPAGFARRADAVAVIDGGGAHGLTALAVLRHLAPHWRTVVVASDEESRRIARALGATRTVEPGRQLAKAVRELSQGLGAELVLATDGDPRVVRDGVAFARPGGATVLLAAGEPAALAAIELRAFVRSGLRLLACAGAARRHRDAAAGLLAARPELLRDLPVWRLPGERAGRSAELARTRPAAVPLFDF